MKDIIRSAQHEDYECLGALLCVAFANDPFVRWILPNATGYIRSNYAYARIHAAAAIPYEACHIIGEGKGMSIWRPPGVAPDYEAIAREVDIYTTQKCMAEFEQLRHACLPYHPHEPHWHLSLIAVDPAYSGQNVGANLLQHGLARCDGEGLPAYLESTNRRNLTFYQRHGFELLSEIHLPGIPGRYPMMRPVPPKQF